MNWQINNGKDINIVIVDSGIDTENPLLIGDEINGYNVLRKNNRIIVESGNYFDNLGHGTAVTSIIRKSVPKANLIVFKIFDDSLQVDYEILLFTLEFILKNINCNLINLSLGLAACEEIQPLKNLCEELHNNGIIIISAFDNNGSLSYPAQFPFIIGVDNEINHYNAYDYDYVEGEVINVRAKGRLQRVAWKNKGYITQGGTSFATAYITSIVAKIMQNGCSDYATILKELKINSKKIYSCNKESQTTSIPNISSAIVFPFNKEIHSLFRFEDNIGFRISGYYDTKYSGKIGKKLSDIIGLESSSREGVLHNIDKLDWESDFDTVIIGHVEEISKQLRENYFLLILGYCVKYKKNIFAFDSLNKYSDKVKEAEDSGIKIYTPEVAESEIPINRFGKLRVIGRPILGIFGTSSKQGKFSLQLSLRNKFINDGYIVGQLGTEPSSQLFNLDEVYPMGYNSNVKVSGLEAIYVLNEMMGRIEDKNPDLIIVGSQSCTVPFDYCNIAYYTIRQTEFIMGTLPDYIILCINPTDDILYINRTIKFIESMPNNPKVVALVVYPVIRTVLLDGVSDTTDILSKQKLDDTIIYFESNIGIPTYGMNEENLNKLYDFILEQLSSKG